MLNKKQRNKIFEEFIINGSRFTTEEIEENFINVRRDRRELVNLFDTLYQNGLDIDYFLIRKMYRSVDYEKIYFEIPMLQRLFKKNLYEGVLLGNKDSTVMLELSLNGNSIGIYLNAIDVSVIDEDVYSLHYNVGNVCLGSIGNDFLELFNSLTYRTAIKKLVSDVYNIDLNSLNIPNGFIHWTKLIGALYCYNTDVFTEEGSQEAVLYNRFSDQMTIIVRELMRTIIENKDGLSVNDKYIYSFIINKISENVYRYSKNLINYGFDLIPSHSFNEECNCPICLTIKSFRIYNKNIQIDEETSRKVIKDFYDLKKYFNSYFINEIRYQYENYLDKLKIDDNINYSVHITGSQFEQKYYTLLAKIYTEMIKYINELYIDNKDKIYYQPSEVWLLNNIDNEKRFEIIREEREYYLRDYIEEIYIKSLTYTNDEFFDFLDKLKFYDRYDEVNSMIFFDTENLDGVLKDLLLSLLSDKLYYIDYNELNDINESERYTYVSKDETIYIYGDVKTLRKFVNIFKYIFYINKLYEEPFVNDTELLSGIYSYLYFKDLDETPILYNFFEYLDELVIDEINEFENEGIDDYVDGLINWSDYAEDECYSIDVYIDEELYEEIEELPKGLIEFDDVHISTNIRRVLNTYFSRGHGYINPIDAYQTVISVIGCGTTGSEISKSLTQLGFLSQRIIDYDLIDTSNITTQIYEFNDLYEHKIKALSEAIYRKYPKISLISAINDDIRLLPSSVMLETEVLILCTDTVQSRLSAVQTFLSQRNLEHPILVIDVRMINVTDVVLYSFYTNDEVRYKSWYDGLFNRDGTLKKEDDTEERACGMVSSILASKQAFIYVSDILKRHLEDKEIPFIVSNTI